MYISASIRLPYIHGPTDGWGHLLELPYDLIQPFRSLLLVVEIEVNGEQGKTNWLFKLNAGDEIRPSHVGDCNYKSL